MTRFNTILMTGLVVLAAQPVWAGHDDGTFGYAQVIEARPVIETVRYPLDRENCWEEQVWHREPAARSATPVILGVILGGLVGNQFGGGSGKTAMTVAGAALGGSVANDVSHRRNPDGYYAVSEPRCEIQQEWQTEERVVAWDVTYLYLGETYQTRMQQEPGERIRVHVRVNPVVD
jgi:uncharacterized protein YcfJ